MTPLAPPIDAKVAQNLSSLADFEVSLGGQTRRYNGHGTVRAAGSIDYQLSQKSTSKHLHDGTQSTAQTVSETLSADFKAANGVGAMLDVRTGNHSTTRIRDRSQVTTVVESATDRIQRVLRKTEAEHLKTVVELDNHREVNRQSWPSKQNFLERLR